MVLGLEFGQRFIRPVDQEGKGHSRKAASMAVSSTPDPHGDLTYPGSSPRARQQAGFHPGCPLAHRRVPWLAQTSCSFLMSQMGLVHSCTSPCLLPRLSNWPGGRRSCVTRLHGGSLVTLLFGSPVAAITKYHKLDGLEQQTFILSQFWRPEV